jgi:hypothetical protein
MGLAQQQADMQNQQLNQQTRANRPNQSSPFATSTWTQGPDGQWNQSSQFSGPLAGLSQSLQEQAAQAMGTPLNFSGLPQAPDGSAAREQAINAAYGSATSRLDPAFQQREQDLQTRLLNQGLQPGSEAYNREMSRLGNERTDAYNQALSSAIGQGTAAGNALFQQGMQSRQQAMEEMLRQRGQAFGEMGAMSGLLGQSGFNAAGLGQAPNLLGAAGMQNAADNAAWQQNQQFWGDIIGNGLQLGGMVGSLFMSDERAKTDVQRLDMEVVPGVPAAVFRYRPEHNMGTGRYVGVVAQDLARALPHAVHEREDGMLMVGPAFAPLPLED